MTDGYRPPQVDELADLPDVLVVRRGSAALAGVIELDAASKVITATRLRHGRRWPSDRLITIDATEALNFLRGDRTRQRA